jgi:hypothetical protein
MSGLSALHAGPQADPRPEQVQVQAQRFDDDSRYLSVALGGAGTAGLPINSVHASYVIVPETDAPHSTLATAQVLPNLPFFGVIGTLSSDSPPDLFEMTLDSKTAGVQFELVAQQPAVSPAVQFSLYDAAGRVLGTWTAGGQPLAGSSSVSLAFPSQSLSATLYLGISVAGSSGSGPAGSLPGGAYQLWVTRVATPDPSSATAMGAGPTVTPTPTSSLILGPFQGPASPPPGQATVTAASTATGAGAGLSLGLAGGSLPTRAAGPLGGVLDHDDASQAAVRRLTVTVNREGAERRLQPFEGHPVVATDPEVEPAPESDPGTLVAIRGPGGFPLLGATPMGNWHRLPPQAIVAADASGAAGGAPEAPAPETQGLSQGTLSVSLTTATFLTLNAILSDPVAGFDYLAACLDSEESDRAQRAAKVRRT